MSSDTRVKFDGVSIATISPKPEDVIVLKYKTDIEMDYLAHICSTIKGVLKNAFPNNTLVAIPDSSCLDVIPKEQLITQLKGMIKMLEEK